MIIVVLLLALVSLPHRFVSAETEKDHTVTDMPEKDVVANPPDKPQRGHRDPIDKEYDRPDRSGGGGSSRGGRSSPNFFATFNSDYDAQQRARLLNRRWVSDAYRNYGGFWGNFFQAVYESAASSPNPSTQGVRYELLDHLQKTGTLGGLVTHFSIYAENWGSSGSFVEDARDTYVQVVVGILESCSTFDSFTKTPEERPGTSRGMWLPPKKMWDEYHNAVDELANYLFQKDPLNLNRIRTGVPAPEPMFTPPPAWDAAPEAPSRDKPDKPSK